MTSKETENAKKVADIICDALANSNIKPFEVMLGMAAVQASMIFKVSDSYSAADGLAKNYADLVKRHIVNLYARHGEKHLAEVAAKKAAIR